MAVFKLVKNPCDTEYALLNLCNYIVRADRTSGHIRGRGLSPNSAYQEILGVHELWGKNSGRLAYHLIVSFDDMEALVPLEAEEIALRVSSLFFPEYQVLYGVHTEQAHLHVHFAVNTVSLRTGRKLHLDFAKQRELEASINSIIYRYQIGI